MTEYLQLLLRRAGYNLHTSAEKEVVRAVKESACYVAFDPAKEEELIENDSHVKPIQLIYKLPDGTSIELGPERFRAPEILFRPDLIGEEYPSVAQCLVNSINRVDLDMRRSLFSSIVLSGGSTMFPGFGDRLLYEVKSLAPKDIKIKVGVFGHLSLSPSDG